MKTALAIVVCLLSLGMQPQPARALDGTTGVRQIEVAFLYNLAKYIEWPADANRTTFRFCSIGNYLDPYFGQLKQRELSGAALVTSRVSSTSPRDAFGCQVLFVSPGEESQAAPLIEQLRSSPVLIVTEGDPAGMVIFFVEGNRVRFRVHRGKIARAHLSASSRLLQVAAEVSDD